MSISKLFSRPIAFHRPLVDLTGGILPALMLSQAIYWTPRTKDRDGWFWKTRDQWQEETGMSRREQETARKKLRGATVDGDPVWFEELRGMPAKLHFRINEAALTVWASGMLGASVPTRKAHSDQQEGTDRANNSIYTETTPETTPEITTDVCTPNIVAMLVDSFAGFELIQAKKFKDIDPEIVAYHVLNAIQQGKGQGWIYAALDRGYAAKPLTDDQRRHPFYIRHFGKYDFEAADSADRSDYASVEFAADASRKEYAI